MRVLAIVLAISVCLLSSFVVMADEPFVRGDCNADGSQDIGDPVFALTVLFSGGGPETCTDACDANDDGSFNIGDPVYKLSYLFAGGPDPLAPFPDCGPDPTADPLSCDSYEPCDTALDVTLDQGVESMELISGHDQFVAYVVEATGLGGPETVTFTQTIVPDNGGISLTSDYPFGGWFTLDDTAYLVNQVVTGFVPGTYTITNTATIVGTGEMATTVLTVTVTAAAEPIALNLPGADPGAIPVGVSTDVVFTCLATGAPVFPASISLDQVDVGGALVTTVGDLFDDGVAPDLIAGDQVYSGTFPILGASEGMLYFRTTAAGEMSSPSELLVTTLPVGVPADDPAMLILDVNGTDSIYADQVLCKVTDPSDSTGIVAAVATIGGTVEGTIPSVGLVVVSIAPGTAQDVHDKAAALSAEPGIEWAEPNGQDETTGFTPSDTSFASQTNMTVIRADEAWIVSRGKVLIAVVDTGVDIDHPDLDAKLVLGKDFVDDDANPDDPDGHGTHVAGIAAAESNNGSGVAGVSWGSKILAVRGIGSHAVFSAAVRYATDKGAKIINYSGSGSDSETKKNAVLYAVGKGVLFVSTPGNTGTNTSRYPGAYAEVLCVGNSTNADGRAASSTYGAHVDICAPGVSVTSTIPGGGVGVMSGTSMSAPLVAGAAAVVWTMHPSWTAAKVRQRLLKSAKPMTASLLIGDRLDLFEAVFNGSFELGDLGEWVPNGTCSSLTSIGALVPQHRARMGYCSTGPAGDQSGGSLKKCFEIQAGVTSVPIKFKYNFVTEEYPEFVGTVYDDFLSITITAPDGTETTLASESVNASTFTSIGGIDFPGGDDTVGHTGWKTATATIPVTAGAGEYLIEISDTGDDIYDSIVLIDNIELE